MSAEKRRIAQIIGACLFDTRDDEKRFTTTLRRMDFACDRHIPLPALGGVNIDRATLDTVVAHLRPMVHFPIRPDGRPPPADAEVGALVVEPQARRPRFNWKYLAFNWSEQDADMSLPSQS